jgi:hypothetical protein
VADHPFHGAGLADEQDVPGVHAIGEAVQLIPPQRRAVGKESERGEQSVREDQDATRTRQLQREHDQRTEADRDRLRQYRTCHHPHRGLTQEALVSADEFHDDERRWGSGDHKPDDLREWRERGRWHDWHREDGRQEPVQYAPGQKRTLHCWRGSVGREEREHQDHQIRDAEKDPRDPVIIPSRDRCRVAHRNGFHRGAARDSRFSTADRLGRGSGPTHVVVLLARQA